jgi:hypothetical protein
MPPTATPAPDTPTPQPTATQPPTPTPTPAIQGREAVALSDGIAFRGHAEEVSQEGGAQGAARQANVAFILDGSGSMNANLPGSNQSRLAVAKEVMAELLPQVPTEVRGALWIYGHRYPQEPQAKSCQDIEQVFDLGPVDAASYMEKVNAVTAIGYTPISDAIEHAARDLVPGDVNSIVLVSDGEETCGGDPCALAEALKASDSAVTIHVVGYAVDEVTREQLQCVAQVSGGTYHDAEDGGGLLEALEQALDASVAETILRIEILGPDGIEQATAARLYKTGTDQLVTGYSTWTDNAAPPGTYDLVVLTLPWIAYPELTIPEHSTTIVRIELGAIRPLTPDGQETTVDIYQAASGERLGHYGGTVLLVPDTYQLEINQSWSDPIVVKSGEAQERVLGAIRVLSPEGEEISVDFWEDVDPGRRLGNYGDTVLLIPGNYVLGVNNSYSDPIPLGSGETLEIVTGAIQVDGSFTLFDATGQRLGAYGDTLLLMPGSYSVEKEDGTTVEDVVVEAGQVTVVK